MEDYTVVVLSDCDTWEEMTDEINVVVFTEEGAERFANEDISLRDILWDGERDGVLEVLSVKDLLKFYIANRKEVPNA